LFPLADERVPEALRRLRLNNHLQGKCPGSGYDDAGLRMLEEDEGLSSSKRQRNIKKIRKAHADRVTKIKGQGKLTEKEIARKIAKAETKLERKLNKASGGLRLDFPKKQAKLQDEGYCPLSTVIPKKFRAR
jgi:hypothetical protein